MTESVYRGYRRVDFEWKGHAGILVFPEKEGAAPRKWVWRTEFFGQFDGADMEMVRRGYCLAHYSISDLYGSPEAVALMDGFYRYVREAYGLARRCILIGLSRGGLYACNFALAYPDRVAAMYLDAPVLDIKSWPRKKAPACWEECKRCYGLTESTWQDFHGSPADRLDELAATGIPIFLVAGDADSSVPFSENAARLIEAFGGEGKPAFGYIVKPGAEHHPHGLEDPTPVCDFLCEKALP